MAKSIFTNNMFFFGEVGQRLDGVRNSEIALQSAKVIRNLYVTELGNLKFAKQFSEQVININNIVDVLDTRYFFYLIVTTDKVYSINKENNAILYQHPATVPQGTNCKMFNDSLVICTPTPAVFEFDKDTGNIGTSNFLDLITYPIIEKEVVKMEVFRVYSIKTGDTTELRVMSLSKYDNPKLEVKSNGVYLESSNIKLDRIYRQSRSTIESDTITGAVDGLTFGVFTVFFNKIVEKDRTKQYILGNFPIEFTGATYDSKYGSEYYTGINKSGIKGELSFGELKELKNNFLDAGVFSNRMYIIKDDILFFSKIDNFFDFRNGTEDDSAFYFKPGPINNQRPKYITTRAGNGLYLATNKGVYVITYNGILNGSSYKVFIASNTPATRECELINDNFYYISEDEMLKCVQPVPNQLGYESYKTYNADKFSINSKPKYLTKIIIDGDTKLVSESDGKVIEIYDIIDINVFRKTSLDINYTNKLFGYNKKFVHDGKALNNTNINYSVATLSLNPPYMKTNNGGTYANDFNSVITKVVMKLLNGDKEAVKGVYIADEKCNNLAKDVDNYSVYKVQISERVENGYNIRILSKETDDVLEVLGIDTFIDVNGDD